MTNIYVNEYESWKIGNINEPSKYVGCFKDDSYILTLLYLHDTILILKF